MRKKAIGMWSFKKKTLITTLLAIFAFNMVLIPNFVLNSSLDLNSYLVNFLSFPQGHENPDSNMEARDYLGLYSFTDDPIGEDPADWIVEEPGESNVEVVSEKDEHGKVVELYRTVTNYPAITNTFPGKSSSDGHEIEFWMWGDSNAQGTFDLGWGLGFDSQIWLHMNFFNGELRNILYGGSSSELLSENLTSNTWHHFRIKVISKYSFEIWLNTEYLGQHNGWFTQTGFSQIQFASWVWNPAEACVYVDAIDYSWAPGYYTNRNMDYELTPIEVIIQKLEQMNTTIFQLNNSAFDKNPTQRKNALSNKIQVVIDMVEIEDCLSAYAKLLSDIKPKLTGLKTDENENPWGNGIFKKPWIIDPDAQELLRYQCNDILYQLN